MSPEKLPKKLIRAVMDASEIGISATSIWETMMLAERGRIHVVVTPETTVRRFLASNPTVVIPVDAEIALLSRVLNFVHEDPADRFIAATAHKIGCPLATVDRRLTQLSWLKTL